MGTELRGPGSQAGGGDPRLLGAGTMALSVLLGLQTMRALLPQMAFLLRDRFGLSALEIGALALSLFCAGFVLSSLYRILSLGRVLVLSALGLGLSRMAMQFWTGDPAADLALAASGLVAFLILAPSLALTLRRITAESFDGGPGALATGWLLGQLADLAIFGALGTYGPVWRQDAASWLGVVIFVASLMLGVVLLSRRLGRSDPERSERGDAVPSDVSPATALAWAGCGPYLFLYLNDVGNPARYGALLGGSHRLAWLVLAAAQLAALLVVTGALRRGGSPGPLMVTPAAVGLIAFNVSPWWVGTPALVHALGHGFLACCLWSLILVTVEGSPEGGAGWRRFTWSHGLSMLTLGLLCLVSAASYDLDLPFDTARMTTLAATFLALAAWIAASALRSAEPRPRRGWRPLLAFGLALAAPSLMTEKGEPISRGDATREAAGVRLMTYNLHCGVTPMGALDLEAMAQAIEAEAPDIVALQEVGRGWPVNGMVDMPEWLARRLGMEFVFAGTVDPLWGNAVLTRLPVLGWRSVKLPPRNLILERGVLEVRLQLPSGEPLRVLATHLHNPKDGGKQRLLQVEALLDLWGRGSATVLLGDLNAKPEAPEIERLRRAGLVDAFEKVGQGPGLTFPSVDPHERIDYIWASPDLELERAWTSTSPFSDHRPVVVELRSGPPHAVDGDRSLSHPKSQER